MKASPNLLLRPLQIPLHPNPLLPELASGGRPSRATRGAAGPTSDLSGTGRT